MWKEAFAPMAQQCLKDGVWKVPRVYQLQSLGQEKGQI
jgi:hypothetical protein